MDIVNILVTTFGSSIVMELAGRNLNTYYDRNSLIISRYDGDGGICSNERRVVLENILKCAAKALQQFHNFGVHNDIKSDNFVTLKEQNELEPLTSCKLIAFNLSKTIGQENVTNEYIEYSRIQAELGRRPLFKFLGHVPFSLLNLPKTEFSFLCPT
uniref:Protein kinase domain-containing protein n=1 Tax=Meloidogyne incognita TaxID=6306 RepID=A0A914MZZ7_MELIC